MLSEGICCGRFPSVFIVVLFVRYFISGGFMTLIGYDDFQDMISDISGR